MVTHHPLLVRGVLGLSPPYTGTTHLTSRSANSPLSRSPPPDLHTQMINRIACQVPGAVCLALRHTVSAQPRNKATAAPSARNVPPRRPWRTQATTQIALLLWLEGELDREASFPAVARALATASHRWRHDHNRHHQMRPFTLDSRAG